MDTVDAAAALMQRALIVALELSLPALLVGMAVGFIASLFQAVTQIQEQTLSFIPKVLAMAGALFLLLPWLLSVSTEYLREMLGELSRAGSP